MFALSHPCFGRWRRVRGRVPRPAEGAAELRAGDRRRDQDAQAGLVGEGALRLPDRGVHHGPVRAPERDLPAGRGDALEPGDDHHRVHGERQPGHVSARERRQVPDDTADRHAARHRGRHDLPERHELRAPGSGGAERAGQLAAGVQDRRLRAVARD